jgi:hypothetical protein
MLVYFAFVASRSAPIHVKADDVIGDDLKLIKTFTAKMNVGEVNYSVYSAEFKQLSDLCTYKIVFRDQILEGFCCDDDYEYDHVNDICERANEKIKMSKKTQSVRLMTRKADVFSEMGVMEAVTVCW